MMYEEFCKLVKHVDISVQLPGFDFYSSVIEPVCSHYPTHGSIKKDFYVDMYINFGPRVFEDMLPKAKKVDLLTAQIQNMKNELNSL